MNRAFDSLDQLMHQAREGDERAYRQFLGEAARRIRVQLYRNIAGDAELEDIVQEALIGLHSKRHTLDPGRPVGPWMRAIVHYKMIDHWRKRGRSPLVNSDADLPVPAETLAGVDIATLLEKLPSAQAAAIRLTHIQGLSGQEAADQEGIGLSALKLRVHRGMLKLKEIVDENGS